MVETRAPGTEQISQRVVVSNESKTRKMAVFEGAGGCPTGAGLVDGGLREAGQGLGGGCKGFGSGGVSGRDTGVRELTRTKRRKMAPCEGLGCRRGLGGA